MTQVWPREDLFTRNPTRLGSGLVWYMPVVPVTGDYAYGTLCDFDYDGNPYPHGRDAGNAGDPCAFLWRVQPSLSVSTEAHFYLGGASALAQFAYLGWTRSGVLARTHSGSLSDDGTIDARIVAPSCYYFEAYLSGANIVFEVGRILLGVRTAYNSVAVSGSLVDVTAPIGLRLDVVDVGGFQVLFCWITAVRFGGVSYAAPIKLFGNDLLIDLTGSAITTQGRSGFVAGQDVISAPFNLRTKVVFFQVRAITGLDGSNLPILGDVTLRDEFERQAIGEAYRDTNDFGVPGDSVQSCFLGDQLTENGTELLVYPTTTLSELPHCIGTSTSATTIYYLGSQRPPDNARNQTPEVGFDLIVSGTSGSTPRTGAGVAVHWTGTVTFGPTVFCYMAIVYRLQTGIQTWHIDLYRVRFGALELLASGAPTFSTASAGSAIRCALEVSPAPNTPSLDGPVRLRVLAGAPGVSEQTLTLQPGYPGVAADGAYIIDSSADRITSGGEGMVFYAQNTTHQIRFTEWDQGTLVDPPTAQNDLPPVPLDAEPTATETINDFAQFVLPITFRTEWETQATRAESGHLWTLKHEVNPRRYWSAVRTRPMTKAKRDAFLAFWREHGKPGGAFFFRDDIKGATYTVRAVEASLAETRLFYNAHEFTFDMEELRA